MYIAAAILVLLWVVGMLTSFTASGFIHILLIFAAGLIVANFLMKRSKRKYQNILDGKDTCVVHPSVANTADTEENE